MRLIATVGEKYHGVCMDTAFTVTARVAGEFSDAPAAVRYRLTERIFALALFRLNVDDLLSECRCDDFFSRNAGLAPAHEPLPGEVVG